MEKRGYLIVYLLMFLVLAIILTTDHIDKTTSIFLIGISLIIVSMFLIMEFKEAINRITNKDKKMHDIESKQIENFQKQYKQKRIQDIIYTLDFNDKVLVNYLLTHNNYSYSELIKKSIGMPTGNFRESLRSLRDKGIIRLEEKGDFVKVSLTKWFLEK